MKAVKVGNIGTDHDGFHPTKVTAGSPDVFIDGLPAARVGDPLEPHDKPNNPPHGRVIATGSSTVFINGRPAALTGGAVSCGGVTIGTGTVNIGDQPPAPHTSSVPSHQTEAAHIIPRKLTQEEEEEEEQEIANAFAGKDLSTTPVVETTKKFKITDIPGVMRNIKKWPKSAELMDLWFSLPAKTMSKKEKEGKTRLNEYPQEYTNTTMFPWSWLEQFENVQEGLNNLKANLDNKAAQKELKTIFSDYILSNKKRTYPYIIPNINFPKSLHSDWQYQRVPIDYGNTMDDLYGSLGNFALYAAILEATITKTTNHNLTPNNYSVHITKVVLYMKDTYEFRGSQYLGHWAFDGVSLDALGGILNMGNVEYIVPRFCPEAGGLVEAFGNADYRKYRKETGLGGDLLLFSDAKTIPVDITVEVTVP